MASLYDEKVLGAKERIALARKLQEQGDNVAAGQMVSGWYVPNTGGAVLGALKNVLGAWDEKGAKEELDTAEREKTAATMRMFNSAGIRVPDEMALQAGTPEQKPSWWDKTSAFVTGGDQPQPVPAKPLEQNVAQNVSPDQFEQLAPAMALTSPELAPTITSIANNRYTRATQKELADALRTEKREQFDISQEGINARAKEANELRQTIAEGNQGTQRAIAAMAAAAKQNQGGGTPSYSSVTLPDGGIGVIDHRTGEIKPYGAGGGALGGAAKPFTDSENASFGQLYKGQQAGLNPRIPAKAQVRYQEWLANNGGDVNAIVSGTAKTKADTSALGAQTKQSEAVKNFSDTFDKNAQMALDFSDKIARTKSPMVNQLIQLWQSSGVQDPELKAFKNVTETAVNEYAKIMSGSTGSSAVSVAAAKHAREMLSTADSPETFKRGLQTLRQEANNRIESFKTGTADISNRLANPQQPVQQSNMQQPVQQPNMQQPVQQQAPVGIPPQTDLMAEMRRRGLVK
jgi:hypothetical protein